MEGPGSARGPCSDAGACQSPEETGQFCRLCWGERELGEAWELISPCSCSGSLQHIHRKCLYDWQQTLRQQGLYKRALVCELCKQPYTLSVEPSWAPRRRSWLRPFERASAHVLAVAQAASVPQLLFRLWKMYVWANGTYGAVRYGGQGLRVGLSLGRHLVEEQAGLLASCLASMTALLGSPYAELLWCQAVGALVVGLLTELVYSSLLGFLLGAVYGFCSGYMGAVRASVLVGHALGAGAVGWVVQLGKVAAAGGGMLLRSARRLPLLSLGWMVRRMGHCRR